MRVAKARKIIKLRKKLEKTRGLSYLQAKLLNKHLWQLNHRTIANALFIGLFWMMIPLPFQMIPAVIMGIYFRANLPITLVCVWISNPLTWLPLYFANYVLGSYLIGVHVEITNWQTHISYILDNVDEFWMPLYLGSIVGGVTVGLSAYLSVYILRPFFLLKKRSRN